MFVQSEKFIEAHGGRLGDVSVYGQESNPTTWRLAAMNLAIRGIDFNLGKEPVDTFVKNQHADLRADFVLANPPFNVSDWWHGSLEGDPRWVYGTPPQGNANYAWLQHMLYHLKPSGRAIKTAQVIEELIEMAKKFREAAERGADLDLNADELTFYNTLTTNEESVRELGDDTLKKIAHELTESLRQNVSVDWSVRESVRAKLRLLVKQEDAVRLLLEQAEQLSMEWA